MANETKSKSIDKRASDKLRADVRGTAKRQGALDWELAALLYQTFTATVRVGDSFLPVYQEWGWQTWEDYVETEVGLHKRTAKSYVLVYETFEIKLKGAYDERTLPQSFGVLRDLCAVVNRKNVKDWFRKTSGKSRCDVVEMIEAEAYGGQPRAMAELRVTMTKKQRKLVQRAIEAVRQAYPQFSTDGECLAEMATMALKTGKLSAKRAAAAAN